MITHVIYEIPGRKIGCTIDLENRLCLYKQWEGIRPEVRILEELHDATDQEAGDRERYWQEKLGYKVDRQHYADTVAMAASSVGSLQNIPHDERIVNGRKGGSQRVANLTPEQLSEDNRRRGLRTLELGVGIFGRTLAQHSADSHQAGLVGGPIGGKIGGINSWIKLTPEERSARAKRNTNLAGLRRRIETGEAQECARQLGLISSKVRVRCPHCRKKGVRAAMHKWHFDNCPLKPGQTNIRIKPNIPQTKGRCPYCSKESNLGPLRVHIKHCKARVK